MDIDIDINLCIQNISDLCDGPGGGGCVTNVYVGLHCAIVRVSPARLHRQPWRALHVAAAGGGVAAPAHTTAALPLSL